MHIFMHIFILKYCYHFSHVLNSGHIITTSALDRENTSSYSITLGVSDGKYVGYFRLVNLILVFLLIYSQQSIIYMYMIRIIKKLKFFCSNL